jgi:hypothetical protein
MNVSLNVEGLVAVGLIGRLAIRVLEVLFAAGMIGSAIVVLITFIEDMKEAFSKDEPATGHTATRELHEEFHSEAPSAR